MNQLTGPHYIFSPTIHQPLTLTPELRQLVEGAIEEFTCGEMECQCGRITETFKDYTETELDEWLKERISA